MRSFRRYIIGHINRNFGHHSFLLCLELLFGILVSCRVLLTAHKSLQRSEKKKRWRSLELQKAMYSEACPSEQPDVSKDEDRCSKVSVVIENNVVKSSVHGAVIPDVDIYKFLTNVWRKYEDRTALVDAHTGVEYTFDELLDACRHAAAGLRNLGLCMGDVVAFHAANSFELLIAMCGTFFAGGIATLVRTTNTKGEIHRQFSDARPKFVFCGSQDIDKIREAVVDVTSVQAVITTTGSCEGVLCILELKRSAVKDGELPLNLNPDAVLLIPYSSGTTGLPKGALLTHRNIIAQITSYGCLGYPMFDSNDVCLCGASLMHVGSFSTLFSYLGHGSKIVLADVINADVILSTIERHKPTMMGLYPALLLKLDQHPLLENFDTSSLINLTYGGCVLNTAVLESITRKLGLKTISQVYGMTELSSCIASTIPLLEEKMCVGKPLPFTQVKVADLNTRKALGPYQRGEVCVKNPCAFKGYLNKPKETADAYEEGFVRTGDMGYYSDDGRIFLCGRLKELIKCMDKQVAPAEIEEVLAADPEVRRVAVAGIAHPKYGEAARAFVVPQHRPVGPIEQQKEADRLKELVAAHLSFHKWLHGGVEFLDSIPQTEIGKHPRTSLREAYMQRQKNVTGSQGGLKRDEAFVPHY